MPIYTYELCEGEDPCKICRGSFELRRPIDRPDLEQCPMCKKKVKKVIGNFNTPKIHKPLSVTDAKNAGFKLYKKRDQGVYEKL